MKVLSIVAGVQTMVTIAAGGVNTSLVAVDFGTDSDYLVITVPATWVASTSSIGFAVTPNLLDHDIEDCLLEQINCTYGNIVAGVSFDLHLHAPNGTWGRYNISAIGA
jgi:hypothetical protein